MKCLNCNSEINEEDNFCFYCGHFTAKGYLYLKNEENFYKINNGKTLKTNRFLTFSVILFSLTFILLSSILIIKRENIFKPFMLIKKEVNSYLMDYKTSIIKTDNKYSREQINNYEEAINFIKKDFDEQSWLCKTNKEIASIENNLQINYGIPSVNYCDMNENIAANIENVIVKMNQLFPNVKGGLTNITITNAKTNKEYIARFQAMYQFVNINDDINSFNKVNKTQILLNSYYFLNDEILSKNIESAVGENYYVEGATWYSTIAHEYAHYLSFMSLLKQNNLINITLVTSSNYKKIEEILEYYTNGQYSNSIVNEALSNYNKKYNKNMNLQTFSQNISKYASVKDDKGDIITEETIAEAIHDYYLHGEKMKNESREIVNIIKQKLYMR